MQTQLRQYLEHARFHLASVQRVAELLPAEDAGLDALVGETVQAGDQKAFMHVIVAALSRERPVAAKHLARGAMMLPHWQWFPLVMRFQGDVAAHLMAAMAQTQLPRHNEAAALLLAAAWCEEHRGGQLPEPLIPRARQLARVEKLPGEAHAFLVALAVRTKDGGLLALTKNRVPGVTPEQWRVIEAAGVKMGQTFLAGCRSPVMDFVHEKPANVLAAGVTLRRAVARVGRNEPCPCGSGKKYKHCCHDKDQERLHHSSEVAGLTQEELVAQPETHLTLDRLNRTDPFLMARLDPRKIPAELERMYFTRLCAFNLFDHVATAFESLGYTPEREGLWHEVMFMATRAGHKDSIRRLAKLYPDPVKLPDEIYLGAALLLAEDNPTELLKLLDESVTKALARNEPAELEGSAMALMYSRFRALGILVARGAIPILPQPRASRVFEEILTARDRLNLPPDDPFSDIMDKRLAEQDAGDAKEAAALRQAQRQLETKAQEVRELKDKMERLQNEIASREKKSAAPAPAVPAAKAAPVDESALKEMRRKVEELKSELKERHHERNALRRELQKTQSSLEEIHKKALPVARDDNNERDMEDSLLLPPDAPETQPVRLIEFPRHFSQTLAIFPRQVARGAMIMIGRLAAGEPAAYVGALRLKATPNVLRQRIGSDYRLLFRLWPERMEVIDLINRKDLDRRIKTLV